MNGQTIEAALAQILMGTGIGYIVNDRQIVLHPLKITQNLSQKTEENRISGRIVDANGEPIIGATIMVKGTGRGNVTDYDGNFIISAEPDAELEISYVGFQTQTVSVAGKNTIVIVLREDTQTLEELVVVGYGTLKKKPTSQEQLHR